MGLFRVLLALSVVFAHLAKPNWYTGFGGDIAVEAFFLISGFYIARILSRTYKNTRKYYINRALRIFPIYYFVLLVTLVQVFIFLKLNIGEHFIWPKNPSEFLAFFTNFTLFGSDWMQFLNSTNFGFNFSGRQNIGTAANFLLIAPAWTLGLELTFYLIAPKIVKLSLKWLYIIVILGFSIRLLFWLFGVSADPWSYRFLLFELPVFFSGVIIFKMQESYFAKFRISITSSYLFGLGMYLLVGFVASHLKLDRIWLLLVTLFSSALLLVSSGESRIDSKVGELSYPIYLSHILVISSIAVVFEKFNFFEKAHGRGIFEVLAVVFIFLTAKGLVIISDPIEKLRSHIRGTKS